MLNSGLFPNVTAYTFNSVFNAITSDKVIIQIYVSMMNTKCTVHKSLASSLIILFHNVIQRGEKTFSL